MCAKSASDNSAVFYILKGQQYIDEAAVCASTYARRMPDVSRILFTVGEGFNVPHVFEHSFPLKPCDCIPNVEHGTWYYEWLYQMPFAIDYLIAMGYKAAIYSDCDTFIVDPVYELFDMVKYFYLLGSHAPGRQTTRITSCCTLAFPELNTGFVPMQICDELIKFWMDVYNTYSSSIDVYGNNDQGAVRDVLWKYAQQGRRFPWYVLPPEYNLRFNFPCAATKRVKVLHGHTDKIGEVSQKVNQQEGAIRAWERGVKCDE